MTHRRIIAPAAVLAAALVAAACWTAPASAALSLVWSDEFDGTALDTSNWSYDIGTGCPSLCGWGNAELEYYRSQNVTVSGGYLTITAKAESYGGASFTSGRIKTLGKRSFLYGRIEMRAKIPTGGGMWPAFWMMPQDQAYGGWAASGEIDIMEATNTTTSIEGTIHYGGTWPDNVHSGGSYSAGGTNFADDFHVYAIEWEPDQIRWYVDDVLYSTKTSAQWYSDGAPGDDRAPFDQPFYIILNAAVGGYYSGCTDVSCVTASLPQQYVVDYVRVYQDTGNVPPTVAITSPTEADHPAAGDIAIAATASDSDGVVTSVAFYADDTLLGVDITEPYRWTWSAVPDGCYRLSAVASDDGGASTTDTVDLTVGAGCGQASYPGTPPAPPVRIEAENYDVGGEGVAYHDADATNDGGAYRPDEGVDLEVCQDAGGGYNTGWTETGEWLEYTVDVPITGEYPLGVRVSSLSAGGTFRLACDGVDLTGDLSFGATGGWQTWTTVTTTVQMPAGEHVLRFTALSNDFNVNWFELGERTTAVGAAAPASGVRLHACYPNPFNPSTTLRFDLMRDATVDLSVFDMAGRRVRTLIAGERIGAGGHEAVWNGRDDAGRVAPAGVYYGRLVAGGVVRSTRMTLVK